MEQDELFSTIQKWNPLVQVTCCLQSYFLSATMGAIAGLSAVAIPQLQQETSFISDGSDDEYLSWFASLPTLTLGIFCAVGGPLGQWLGRKRAISVITPLFFVAFAIQGLAQTMYVLQIGRILSGVASGLICGPSAAYLSEISDSRWRTTLSSVTGASYLFGMVVMYCLGAALPWRMIVWISIVFPALSFIFSFLSHESPSWLVSKGRIDEAIVVLSRLQGLKRGSGNVDKDTQEIINTEILIIQESLKTFVSSKDSARTCCQKLWDLARRVDIRKPFFVSIIMSGIQQFSGVPAISYYAVSVLVKSKSSVNEYLGTILFGMARLVSMLLSSFLLYRFRRQHLFVFSATLSTIGMVTLALWNFFGPDSDKISTPAKSTQNISSINLNFTNEVLGESNTESSESTFNYMVGVAPLAATLLAVFGYQIGLSPITWSYTAELFPLDVRAEMSGISQAISSMFIFLTVKLFPFLSSDAYLGLGGVISIQAGVCFLAALYGIFFMPETKNKRLEQVNSSFKKGRKEDIAEKNQQGQ